MDGITINCNSPTSRLSNSTKIRITPEKAEYEKDPAVFPTEQIDKVIFGGKADDNIDIPEKYHPVTLSKDGWKTQLAIVKDADLKDHLVFHTKLLNGHVMNGVLGGVPSMLPLTSGPFRISLDPSFGVPGDVPGDYSIFIKHEAVKPVETSAVQIYGCTANDINSSVYTIDSLPNKEEPSISVINLKTVYADTIDSLQPPLLKDNNEWITHCTPKT